MCTRLPTRITRLESMHYTQHASSGNCVCRQFVRGGGGAFPLVLSRQSAYRSENSSVGKFVQSTKRPGRATDSNPSISIGSVTTEPFSDGT